MTNKPNKKDRFSELAAVDDDFSETSLQLIQTWCKKYGNQFLQQASAGMEWCDETREEFPFLLTQFSALCYRYYLEKPGQWRPKTVSEVLVNILPRKIIAEETFFIAIVPLLVDFLAWIEIEGDANHYTTALQEALLNSEDQMLANASSLEEDEFDIPESFLSTLAIENKKRREAQEKRNYARQDDEILTVADIVDDLRYWTRNFPEAAIKAAIEQREAITPLLIDCFQEALQNYEKLIKQDFSGHVYALFLLASFRETATFPLAIKIASLPEEVVDELLGDILTEDLHRILASLYDNDLESLQELIENPGIGIWSRNAGLNSA